jgi:lipoprotein NlpD
VVDGFNPSAGLNKGIDIQGKLGEPVVAAADGEVVYSGTGLRGYGKLLIVKHNEQYLSAYAHNRVLLVAEGDRVKAGQKIAEVGFSGTNTAKLHFEIRLDGKPVNPLQYLPAT